MDRYNFTYTENGAGALKSTLNACLDAFGSLGAMKNVDEAIIKSTFYKAFAENRELAMRMLFYMRDIRGGQGMRRVFRVIVSDMAYNYPNLIRDNLENFLFFGRGDDLLCLLDTPIADDVYAFMWKTIKTDLNAALNGRSCSLLAKWLPSCNTSSKNSRRYAMRIINAWGITPRTYRKTLATLRHYLDVTEVKMSANEWNKIDYEAVPAKAAMNYSDAFQRHDYSGYMDYMLKVAQGKAKVNSKSLFPVDILHKVLTEPNSQKNTILWDAMWEALPNYFEGKEETGICMVDTSGSMRGTPYEVALSLGIYCADKCHGPFKNHFITFATRPELVSLRGETITEKVHNVRCINAGNTDIEAAFDLILRTAVANHCTQEEIPSKLYIISDMQFDEARGARDWWGRPHTTKPFMQQMKEKYAFYGYKLPIIVYWNVNAGKGGMFQQTFEDEDCAMVSGYSPSLFKAVIEGTTYEEEVHDDGSVTLKEKVDPIEVMTNTLMNERYDRVVV